MTTPDPMNNERWSPKPLPGSPLSGRTKEEWEDWEDDEVLTPTTADPVDEVFIDTGSNRALSRYPEPQLHTSSTSSRMSVQKIRRLKSRHRQKAQNAKAGIKLVTDMSKFRQQKQQQRQQQQQQHIANQMREAPGSRESRTGKFVDAAALLALEGEPSGGSNGAFGWLKRRPTKGKRVDQLAAETPVQNDLSPSAGPIMIGFEMPKDSDVVISPQTAVVETPVDFPFYFAKQTKTPPSKLPVSAWSPDTEDEASLMSPESVILSQKAYVPAVPSIPQSYKEHERSAFPPQDSKVGFWQTKGGSNPRDTVTTAIYVSDDDGDMETPVTLFEEDASPAAYRKSYKVPGRKRSTTIESTRSQGWWDQITSPFVPTPATPQVPNSGAASESNWWQEAEKKQALSPVLAKPTVEQSGWLRSVPRIQQAPPQIIIQDFSPVELSSPEPAPRVPQTLPQAAPRIAPPVLTRTESRPEAQPSPRPETQAEISRILTEESRTPELRDEAPKLGNDGRLRNIQPELPPPYSPPHRNENEEVRYRAVFPPGHHLNSLYPPSPGPVPAGLSQTMTSQGAIGLQNVPLTPPPTQQRLPERPLGSFVPADHFYAVTGRGARQKAERQRRRHEKEDYVARRMGRGCFPCCGCIGRPGAEGRKRRRWCFGIFATLLSLIILGVVLGVVLSRRTEPEVIVQSKFLNLTDFPPMPTGLSTIINTEMDATTICVNPPTLWSCSLPKEERGPDSDPDQLSFVLQIQFDNDTRQLWNVTGQEPPKPTPSARRRSLSVRSEGMSFSSFVRRAIKGRQTGGVSSSGFRPSPDPPSFQEMFFLGNTTDGIVSEDKAGESTPFYISMLRSVNDTAGPNVLSRRTVLDSRQTRPPPANVTTPPGGLNVSQLVPPPVLNNDGTGAPATLLPFPTQQPVRLYDRGLPTERYSFYSYYNKTLYVKSVDAVVTGKESSKPVPADLDGGSLRAEANFLVTWLSVRYKVEIWTRRENTTRLIGGFQGRSSDDNSTQPGTFPYPVTITLDTHGGKPGSKFTFVRGMDDRQRIELDNAKFVLNFMNTTGDHINPAGQFNPSFGGMDGGTGGCKCAYTNFVGLNGARPT